MNIVVYIERLFAPHWGWIGALFYAQNQGQNKNVGFPTFYYCLFSTLLFYLLQVETILNIDRQKEQEKE